MSLLIRQAARVQLARSFYRDIFNENDFFYMFASRAIPWTDDNTPDTPRDSQFYQADYRHNMMFVKRVQAADAVQLIPRYDWTTGTIYDQYDDEYADECADAEDPYECYIDLLLEDDEWTIED